MMGLDDCGCMCILDGKKQRSVASLPSKDRGGYETSLEIRMDMAANFRVLATIVISLVIRVVTTGPFRIGRILLLSVRFLVIVIS